MQSVVRPMPGLGQTVEHIAEIVRIGLVGADLLGRVDCGEGDPEPGIAAGKTGAADIRQDDEPVTALEIGQRLRAIGKGGPLADRIAEGAPRRPIGRDLPLRGETEIDTGEQLAIEKARGFGLLRAFVPGEGCERGFARRTAQTGLGGLGQQRLQRGPDPALPIDQGAVAIEAEHAEIAEPHPALPTRSS
jgi:hypothetical protein